MQSTRRPCTQPSPRRRLPALLGLALAMLCGFILGPTAAVEASSHREAPLIALDPFADTTDVYAFISPDRPDAVNLVGNWIPFEHADGGPNYYRFADDVRYEIHVDSNGDAQSDTTYRFEFETNTGNPATFLYNTGPVTSLDDENLNIRQTYRVTEVRRDAEGMLTETVIGEGIPVPPPNIGSKSTPDYPALADAAVRAISTPAGDMMVFAGPRDDPFFVDLGSIFDLLSLRPQPDPIGYDRPSPGLDALAGYNVHSIALQVPIDHLLTTEETVIGVWATSSRQAMRTIAPLGQSQSSGDWVQISRLGMPLTNEVVLPRALKDAFNGLAPSGDFDLFTSEEPAGQLLAQSVLDPEMGRLLSGLYGVPMPEGPRNDLLSIFLTGMVTTKPYTIVVDGGDRGNGNGRARGLQQEIEVPAGTVVNQPTDVRPAEMLRLNTAPPFRPGTEDSFCGRPNHDLGVLGGDVCGFPNGRRLGDDVTDIALLAVAGAAYSVLTDGDFDFNPDLIEVLDDGVSVNDRGFASSFPYLATPHQGQEHEHAAVHRVYMAMAMSMY